VVSRLDFLRRFTRAERIALRAAETTDPVVADFLLMLTLAEDVDLTSPDVTDGLAYLEANGFVTSVRGVAIRSG
jgi:DNA-binding MarR family transcriptional regulator